MKLQKNCTNFDFLEYRLKFPPVDKINFIVSRCRGKRVLDLGCVQHSFKWATNDQNWLHKKISNVASYILGIDYLKSDIKELKKLGFNIICADVTKPLYLKRKYDVIVAGDLIEHLVNFEGFFNNLKNFLSTDGEILIVTPNPFYINRYFYTAFKNSIVVNPEHTCWIDQITLNQLAERFGFTTTEIHYIKDSWNLGFLIQESKNQFYDMHHGKWIKINPSKIGIIRRVYRRSLTLLYFLYCKFTQKRDFNKYDDFERADSLERYVIERFFQLFWNCYKLFIIKSELNKYERYISILKLK